MTEIPLSPRRAIRWRRIGALCAAVGLLLPTVQNVLTTSASASTTTLTLTVKSARTEPLHPGGAVAKDDAIPAFKYLINEDNTGTTTQRTPADGCSPAGGNAYPASCKWTSAGTNSQAPIYAQGDQSDFDGDGNGLNQALTDMPPGRYLISVLADGYKLDGTHFTIPLSGPVEVKLQPFPLPTATVKAQIFEDISPTNSAADLPAEHGLPGFRGQLADYLGQLITDVYGNPLCTDYLRGGGHTPDEAAFQDPPGATATPLGHDRFLALPIDLDVNLAPTAIVGTGGECVSDINGVLTMPNLGPNRYTLQAIAPSDPTKGDVGPWIQTTTLEGNHDWDAWVMEGSTGLDTEFVQGGEPFPAIVFGFVKKSTPNLGGAAHIKGVVDGVHVYVPTTGGATQANGTIFGGLAGTKIDHPISLPWLSLNTLSGAPADTALWIGQGNADGSFDIPNVPNGNYTLTWWDAPQNYILDVINVTVANGETVDMGVMPLNGWWTYLDGYVFNDTNRNGIREAGEPGIPNFTLTLRKRENSLMDRGTTAVTTDNDGHYVFEGAYPMTQWLVMEAYNDRFYTTGATFQADNQDTPTTITGAGVDMSVLPIIGLSGKMDWGVHAYDPTGSNGIDPRNGGIVGTVSYDTTRNELDPRYAAVEDWQPGVSGLDVKLYQPIACGTSPSCDAGHRYQTNADGSYKKGQKLNTYVTETWHQPTDCVARDVNGDALTYPAKQRVLPNWNTAGAPCLEGPLMGVQYEQGYADVNGNYGFGDGCFVPNVVDDADVSAPVCKNPGGTDVGFTALPGGKDYLVDVEIPNDATGRPMYKFTREEDINIANGDTFIPQVPPSACAGANHIVDVAGMAPDGANATDNPTFLDIGGSPYEGQVKPLCNTKLVTLANGKSVVPTFNVFTNVPTPVRFWGLLVDDLNFSGDPQSLTYGEKAGISFAPVGVYDYTNTLMFTTESDYNGLWDVLMPSTNRINCPTPSGVCANLYRFVGNDPGVPGRLNTNYRPEFRTIAAEFEALPGLIVPADLAPHQVGVSVQVPGGQTNRVQCAQDVATPQFFSINKPYGAVADTFTITGVGFGSSAGRVNLDGLAQPGSAIVSWADRQIKFRPDGAAPGPHQLSISSANGQTSVDGITLHVIGVGYTPNIYEVGPGKAFPPANTLPDRADHAIQNAVDAAAGGPANNDLVVVYPQHPGLTDTNPRGNPRGAYYENVILYAGVKLQGTGPGGVYANGEEVPGAIIDGSAFGGDGPVAADWLEKVSPGAPSVAPQGSPPGTPFIVPIPAWQGNQNVNDGAVISIFTRNNRFLETFTSSIDGFDIRGGDQVGFPNNINIIGGGATGLPAGVVTQGGAIFANAFARFLQITNNVIQNNGGAYGTVRIGTPDLPGNQANNNNNDITIANNRIMNNAGTNLAGGIGLFSGSDGFTVSGNDICGNFSAEYGGGITVYGKTPGTVAQARVNAPGIAPGDRLGRIDHNRIYFNSSYDEGGGVMVSGTLPANPTQLSTGSAPIDITGNLIQANLSNDDGGGVRFLMAGTAPMNVINNIIVNNVSTHEGGGVGINDTPNVRVINNTIMKNLTTATAVTSDGTPMPAGVATSQNSALLQATLPSGSPIFSKPVMFNNILWDNRAGTRSGAEVTGIGAPGDVSPINEWDIGVSDTTGVLAPTNSIIGQNNGSHPYVASPTNQSVAPAVSSAYDVTVTFNVWRNNPAFVGATLVAVELPVNLMGDYHITPGSPARDSGAASATDGTVTYSAPGVDYDRELRPALAGYDIGADEIQLDEVDLIVTKTDGVTSVRAGDPVTYTVIVSNSGPGNVANAIVTDTLPGVLGGVTWTCAATAGSACATSGSGSISTGVDLLNGGSATFTVHAIVSGSASGSFTNTAVVSVPVNAIDNAPANNSASDTDTVIQGSDLSITKTDGRTTVTPGMTNRYTIVVSNAGPGTATNATVVDTAPALFTNITYTCSASVGSSCGAVSGIGALNSTVTLVNGGTATYTVTGTVSAAAPVTGAGATLANTVVVTPTAPAFDPNAANNSATDSDLIRNPTLPTMAITDRFDRDGPALGANWNAGSAGSAIRIVGDAASGSSNGKAMWVGAGSPFGVTQAASVLLRTAPVSSPSFQPGLVMKATGGTTPAPSDYLTVTVQSGQVNVSTVTSGGAPVVRGTKAGAFAINNRITAVADGLGNVFLFRTTGGGTTTYLGLVAVPIVGASAWTQPPSSRIGIQLPAMQRLDDFRAMSLVNAFP